MISHFLKKRSCPGWGSNSRPSDYETDALPTALPRLYEKGHALVGKCEIFPVLKPKTRIASAGNRTRVNCLEGSYAHHYTTNACIATLKVPTKLQNYTAVSPYLKWLKKVLQSVWQTCTLSSFWMFANSVADVHTFGTLNALNFSAPHPTPVDHSSRSI